jgi:hypothetical protein
MDPKVVIQQPLDESVFTDLVLTLNDLNMRIAMDSYGPSTGVGLDST